MKTLDQQMSVYAAYHRHPLNRATHFVGVPMIILAILVPMGWLRLGAGGLEFSLAHLFVLAVLAYYFALDVALALAMTVFTAIVLAASEAIAALPFGRSLACFAALLVPGWSIQLVGHAIEGRRPALADNLFQIFVAPIFLMAEVFFALGWKLDMHERLAHAARPAPERADGEQAAGD